MLQIIRTNSDNPDFYFLTQQLDEALCEIYGTKKEDFEDYNRIENLETIVIAYEDEVPVGCGCFKKFNSVTNLIKKTDHIGPVLVESEI